MPFVDSALLQSLPSTNTPNIKSLLANLVSEISSISFEQLFPEDHFRGLATTEGALKLVEPQPKIEESGAWKVVEGFRERLEGILKAMEGS